MIIYLVSLLPARSNGLPGGTNEAGRFIPPYLAFLPVGFAMPLMSPSERWALTLSRYLSLFLTRETTPPFHPYSIKKMERYIFCCTFLPVTGTPRYGALRPMELGLSSRPIINPKIHYNRRSPRLLLYFFIILPDHCCRHPNIKSGRNCGST